MTGDHGDPADTGPREESLNGATAVRAAAEIPPERAAPTAPGLPIYLALAAILLIAGAITMGETDRLITGALTPYGSSRSVTDVIGLAAFTGGDAWRVWLDLPDELRQSVAIWIIFHAFFDIAFYLGYWLLLRRLVSPVSAAKRALLWLLVFEMAETILLWVTSGFLHRGEVPGFFQGALAVVAWAKWLTAGLLVLVILADKGLRGAVASVAVRLLRAVWEQRLSLVLVTVVGVLTLVPGPDIWDQLPDVERSWVDGDLEDGLHPLWAVTATVVVSLFLFVVGRLRSERVWATRVGNPPDDPPAPPQDPPKWWWWLVPPLLALATALLLEALPVDGLVDWPDVGWPVMVPLSILFVSWLVVLYYKPSGWLERLLLWLHLPGVGRRWLRPDRSLWQEPAVAADDPGEHRRALDVWVAGDILAVSVLVVAALGLVRSLTAPVLLGPPNGGTGPWLLRVAVLVAAAAVALVAFPLANGLLARLDGEVLPEEMRQSRLKRLLRPSDNRREGGRWRRSLIALALWVLAVAPLMILMVWPLQVSDFLGVVATTLLALGAWATVLGLLIVHLQYRRPLPVFSVLRMRTTPVLTLLLVVPLLASQAGGDPDLHALSAPPGGPPAPIPSRPSLSEAFADWLNRSQDCDRPIDTINDQNVRPMVLVAASGGGIRAAVWTAAVMDRLGTGGDCASRAVFLSSGISGGSVGLALSRGDDPTAAGKELAEPDALAAGIAGTLVGDLFAGSTGLRIPSLSLVDEEGKEPAGRARWDWRDRAGLMEAVWESKARFLTGRYNQLLRGPAGVLVLNSAAAGRGCRVFVSQVELATGPQEKAEAASDTEATRSPNLASCQGRTNQPAASLDLQDTYGDCMPDMSWATAAMLSARFSWVLPGGRVPPVTRTLPSGTDVNCAGQPNLQLIDGGYAEASGIGTLADIAPALLQVVRDHNATLAGADPVVVPVILYLEDETRRDIVRQPQGLSPELFVPVAGRNAAAVQVSSGTWLQRVAGSIADPCPAVDRQRCLDAVDAVQGRLSGGIVIAAPLTKPSVEAPLGWTLSEDSRNRLEEAAEAQATECPPVRPGGYPCLKQLLDVLEPNRT